jgi:hypothetical protein
MRKIIFISEECHGTIGAASSFEKAKQFLLESGWVDEGFDYYAPGADSSIPIKDAFGENWQEEFMKMEEDDFDGQFYFYEKDFLE